MGGILRRTEMSRKKLVLGALFGLIVLLIVVGIALWFGSGFAAASASAEKVYRDFEAEGIPLDSKAFAASLRIPDEENNAPELLLAIKALKEAVLQAPKDVKYATREYRPWDAQVSSPSVQDREEAFSTIARELDRVSGSLSKSGFAIERNWDGPVDSFFDDLSFYRDSVIMLLNRACLRAEVGDRAAAVSDLNAAAKITSFGGHTPTLIHCLVQAASLQLLAKATLECVSVDPGGARAYGAGLELVELKPYGYFWRGEMYFMVSSSRQIRNWEIIERIKDPGYLSMEDPKPPYVTTGLGRDVLARASLGYALQKLLPVLRTLNRDGSFKDERKYIEEINKMASESEKDRSWPGGLLRSVSPVYRESHEASSMAFARLDMARAIASVQEYENTAGRYPKTLAEVRFEGLDRLATVARPYGLKVTDDEIRVWSVGLNGTDENGLDLFDPEEAKAAGMEAPTGFKDGDLVTRMKIR